MNLGILVTHLATPPVRLRGEEDSPRESQHLQRSLNRWPCHYEGAAGSHCDDNLAACTAIGAHAPGYHGSL